MYVETFKADVTVFIGIKRQNVASYWPIVFSVSQSLDTDYEGQR
jgi:hypothetical protein